MSRILIKDETAPVLLKKLILAESMGDRLRGLLGRATLAADTGLLLRPCRSIHMWFMRFPIDAAFLDKKMQVLKIVRNLRPWQIAFAPRKTHCVLETTVGALDALNPGDTLEMRDSGIAIRLARRRY